MSSPEPPSEVLTDPSSKLLSGFLGLLEEKVSKLSDEVESSEHENAALAQSIQAVEQSLGRIEAERKKIQVRLELQRESVEMVEERVAKLAEELEATVDARKAASEARQAQALELRRLKDQARGMETALKDKEREAEAVVKEAEKHRMHREKVEVLLPKLLEEKTSLQAAIAQATQDTADKEGLGGRLEKEVELMVSAFLKQEEIEKTRKDEFATMKGEFNEVAAENEQIRKHAKQTREQTGKLKLTETGLSKKLGQVAKEFRQTLEQIRGHQVAIDEAVKRKNENEKLLQAITGAYEQAKQDRTNKVNAMHQSAKRNSELREKYKLIKNQVDILMLESQAKDKTIGKTKADVKENVLARDKLLIDMSKLQNQVKEVNSEIEQAVILIDKLNSEAQRLRKHMNHAKQDYQASVQHRNAKGLDLVDINDQLCVLYEKAGILEKVLANGEARIIALDEDIKIKRLDFLEAERQLLAVKKKLPEILALQQELVALQTDLDRVKMEVERVGADVENPSKLKFRVLGGEDLDKETLKNKIELLEAKLDDKKELIIMQEKIFDELAATVNTYQHKYDLQIKHQVELSVEVNDLKSIAARLAKKLLASVAELAMYQAKNADLGNECQQLQTNIDRGHDNLLDGQPPSSQAEEELRRHQTHQRIQAELHHAYMARVKQIEDMLERDGPKSTAEPRVTAYVPENDPLNLPRPYGAHAPFLPQAPGANMRHIRKPQPRPIEL